MMRFFSRWRKHAPYQSLLWLQSESFPGVSFSLRKVSLSQRIELSSRIRELTIRNEFLRAGQLTDQLEAGLADLMAQKLYVEWAVAALEGLRIDGEKASVAKLIEHGPETLVAEIAAAIRSHLELSDAERKNF